MKMLSEDSISVNSLFVEPPKQHKSFSLVGQKSQSVPQLTNRIMITHLYRGNVKRSRIMIPSALIHSTWVMMKDRARGKRGLGKSHRWPTYSLHQCALFTVPNSLSRNQSVGC